MFLDNIKSIHFRFIYFSPIIYNYSDQGLKKDYMEENQDVLQKQNQDDSGDKKHILQEEKPQTETILILCKLK